MIPGLQQAAANGLDSILNKETKLDRELKEIIKQKLHFYCTLIK
jgi:hypothetical protein